MSDEEAPGLGCAGTVNWLVAPMLAISIGWETLANVHSRGLVKWFESKAGWVAIGGLA